MTDTQETKRPVGRPPRQEAVQEQRRRRVDLGANRNLKLHVPESEKDPNFVYRWVNDRGGRVRQMTTEDDYDVVSKEALETNGAGTTVSRVASPTSGENAVLLRKPKKYFEDDQAQKAAAIKDREKALKRGAPASAEGLTGPESYVPGGSNRVG